MPNNDVTIRVGSHDTSAASLDDLKAKLADLGRTHQKATVNLSGKAAYDADKLRIQLDALSRKIASPKISIAGVNRALLDMQLIQLKLDALEKHPFLAKVGVLASGVGAGAGRVAGGAGAAGGLFAAGASALAIAGPIGAATAAMGAFGAVAIGEITKVNKATKANTAAQQTYNNSIASAKATYDKQMAAAEKQLSQAKTAQQRQAALNKEHAAAAQLSAAEAQALGVKDKATTKLTGSEQGLAKVSQGLGKMWRDLETSMAPVILSVARLAVRLAKDFMPLLGPLVVAGSKVIDAFLKPLDKLITSTHFYILIGNFVKFSQQVANLAGPQMVRLLDLLLTLFVKLMPAGVQILKALLPALLQMIADLTPAIVIVANLTAKLLTWLSVNKLLVPVLFALLGAFVAMKVGVVAGLAQIGKAIFAAMGPWGLLAAAVLVAALLIIKYHRQIWDFIQRIWRDVKNFVIRIWDDILAFAKQWWPLLLGPGGVVVKYHNQILSFIRGIWNTIKNAIASAWNATWNNTVSRVARGVSDVVGWVRGLPGKIVAALGNAGNTLFGWGKGVIQGLLNGMSNIIGSVWTFIKGIPGKILNFLGIKSPPQWAIDAGKHIMNGLGIGMSQAKNILGKAVTASTAQFSSQALAGSVGGGVAQWRGLVLKALKMEGLSSTLADAVLYQMQTESGGRVNAINLTDSNARAGHPSKGLMQVIGPTFAAYHWPGTSGNIYDPLANIAAAINYARHNYGPGLRNAYGGIGTGRGYASGGISGGGWAMVGEHGRELVKLPAGSHVYSNADSAGMGGGGTHVIQLEVSGGQSPTEQFLLLMIRNLVRVKGGGDVQKAFGR